MLTPQERNRVSLEFLPLIKQLSCHYYRNNIYGLRMVGEASDLIQENYMAVLNALDTFDPDHPKANLKCFVITTIHHNMIHMRCGQNLIRVPRNMHPVNKCYHKNKCYQKNSPAATSALFSVKLQSQSGKNNLNQEEDQGAERRPYNDLSMPLSYTTDYAQVMDNEEVLSMLKTLPKNERRAIIDSFGLDGDQKDLLSLSRVNGVHKTTIGNWKRKGLQRLRERFTSCSV